jgi:dihydroxyacetone kinase-like protein
MKKLVNDPADVVAEALLGVAAAHADLRVDHEHKIVFRATAPAKGKVGLVSGGGSGHEPLHVGFVGSGMLDAACAGEVFTSPVPDQVLAATKQVDAGAGVLHIVKNYTGDVMNFEMAAELAAGEPGVEVATVIVDDDVAVRDSLYTAGRRGVGATVLLEKIAGAAAEQGRPLAEVAGVAREVNSRSRSMGMALTSCTVPAARRSSWPRPRSSSASASMGSRAGSGARWWPPSRSRSCCSIRSSPTGTSPAPTRSSRSSTDWAAHRCSSSI